MDNKSCRGMCGGTGKIPNGCPVCLGKRTVDVECTTCDGTGKLDLEFK